MEVIAERLETIAYAKIKKIIISAEFSPGSLISENELSRRLEISRTPVHTAMIKLEQEGFVELFSKRGAIVKEVSFSEFYEMHETIVALERFALSRAKSRTTLFDLNRLKAFLDRQISASEKNDHLAYYDSSFNFAAAIIETANNRKMLDILDQYRDRIIFKIVTYRKAHPESKPLVSLRTNSEIYQALADGNIPKAMSELSRNLAIVSRNFMKDRRI